MKQFTLWVVALLLALPTFAQSPTADQKKEAMQQVHDFLKRCGTYYLATVDGDSPRVRPFGTIHLYEGKLYIQTGRSKRVAKQLAKNPKAEICAFNGTQWIRVQTTLHEDTRKAAKASMLDAYPNLKSIYSVEDPNTLVLYLQESTATLSSFSGKEVTLRF
ncbi:MAG: pyridoxamine 5'-phosphate oxidase family protein [Prevotellaceae bacterium]|jgi:uncharacterized pyridoxamine 5'-phosphate oxidase family protein|nr:pyridoxamine 5'-phosphate oxidase family protein [Prevotellaceae bacterium]